MGRWLEFTRDTVGLRTYQRSEETARLHVEPPLGKVKLDKLTAMQLDGLYRKKLKAGLSPRSVQIIHATAHKALKQAVRWRLVRENVAEHATPPKTTKREMQPLTKDQTQILLRTAKRTQPKMYALYALAVTTGARLGELLALHRGDVDLEAGTLRISKSVHNGRVTIPKTSAGRRTIRVRAGAGHPTRPSRRPRGRRVAVPVSGKRRYEHPPRYAPHHLLETSSQGIRTAAGDKVSRPAPHRSILAAWRGRTCPCGQSTSRPRRQRHYPQGVCAHAPRPSGHGGAGHERSV